MERNGLQIAAQAMTAMHSTGRGFLRTRAHLRAWLVARQRGLVTRGLTVEDCDAIADAAMAGMYDLLAQWAAESDDEDG